MSEEQRIEAQPAVLQATISITRKATGLTETYQITGTPMPEQKEPDHGSDAPRSIP